MADALKNSDTSNARSLIPPDVLQHITSETLVFLNKHDLVSIGEREDEMPAVIDMLHQITPTVWTGSVLENDSGGMDAFMKGLVDVLKQRSVMVSLDTAL